MQSHHIHSQHPSYLAMVRNREATDAMVANLCRLEREAKERQAARDTRGSKRFYRVNAA